MKELARRAAFLALALGLGPLALAQSPARDNAAQALAPATGSIRGQVVTDEAMPRPVRKAIVTLSGDVPASRGAVTDDEGTFLFSDLPAGRFTISAKKPAYLPAAYGAVRPGRPGTPVSLAAGQQANVAIKMARGGVLTGTIRDGNGRPMPGVQVQADTIRKTSPTAPPAGTSTSDDRGQYRIYGLLPGEYLVSANPSVRGSGPLGARSTADTDALLAEIARRRSNPTTLNDASAPRTETPLPAPPAVGYVAVYYPGTWLLQEATAVRLAAGDERGGLDFAVTPVGTGKIEGTLSGPVANLATVQLSITPAGQQGLSSSNANPVLTRRPGVDGRFGYSNVPPGRYTIMARANPDQAAPAQSTTTSVAGGGGATPPPGGRPEYLYAMAEVDARGSDIVGIDLALLPGSVFSGRVQFESPSASVPPDVSNVTIVVTPPAGTGYMQSAGTIIGNTFSSVGAVTVRADGGFMARAVAPGAYTLRGTLAAGTPGDWFLRSAMVGGRDVLDHLLEVKPGENITGAVLTFSDQHTELSGVLQTSAGAPASDFFVVVFPANPTQWQPRSRRIKSTRPGSDGRFSVRDLPAGNYLVAALTDVEPADLDDPKFLEQIGPAGLRVTLADGEKKTQDLRIAR